MVEKDINISGSLVAARPSKRKGEPRIVCIQVELPADAFEFEGEETIAEIDTTPEDEVLENLSPGVDIVKPGKPSKTVLKETRYKVKESSEKPLLLG